MSELTERARELLDGITPWPWEAFYHNMDTSLPADYYAVVTEREGDVVCAAVDDQAEGYEGSHGEFGRDARFIAAAPQLVAELVAAVERVEKLADMWSVPGLDWEGQEDMRTDNAYGRMLRDTLEGKVMSLVTIECSRPGDPYTLFKSGADFDVHLAGPSQHGTGPILCGFDRFQRDENGRLTVGFSIGGGCTGPGYRHHPCARCAELAGDQTISGTHRNLFALEGK